jgi:hypothetical protein
LNAIGSALVILAAAGAGIYADPLSNYYGNTLIGTTAEGKTARASLARDGTFVGTGPQGTSIKGHWSTATGELCFTVTEPAQTGGKPVCIPLSAHKVGDKWQVNDGQRAWAVTLQTGA